MVEWKDYQSKFVLTTIGLWCLVFPETQSSHQPNGEIIPTLVNTGIWTQPLIRYASDGNDVSCAEAH
jgi:hypothetical protein